MDKRSAIEMLFGELVKVSSENQMNLGSLGADWGNANSPTFNRNKVLFMQMMRDLAKRCSVKYFSSQYYLFTGKIYEVVEEDVLNHCYELLLEHYMLAPMISKNSIRKECFLDVIRLLNPLVPRYDVVAFNNGVLMMNDPKHPKLVPFHPDLHCTYYHPYDYNPAAKCDRWKTFLYEVLPDKTQRTILQMFLGLGLTQRGDVFARKDETEMSKIEICLMLVGSGANGKSVIFEVARAIFGKENISSMDYEQLTADGDEGMRGRFPIRNAVFNWSSDSDPKKFGKKNTGMFKRIVSGEPVPYRKLGRDVMTTGSLPYLIFALNALPNYDDTSLGFIRRLQYIAFNVTIPKERQDPMLASKLIKSELPGIFNWILRGSNEARFRHYKFPDTPSSRLTMLRSLLMASPVLAWLKSYELRSEALTKNEVFSVITSKSLYEAFCSFCEVNNVDPTEIPTLNMFGRILWDKCGFVKTRIAKGSAYKIYGATEESIQEPFILAEKKEEEFEYEDSTPYGFIKGDD